MFNNFLLYFFGIRDAPNFLCEMSFLGKNPARVGKMNFPTQCKLILARMLYKKKQIAHKKGRTNIVRPCHYINTKLIAIWFYNAINQTWWPIPSVKIIWLLRIKTLKIDDMFRNRQLILFNSC